MREGKVREREKRKLLDRTDTHSAQRFRRGAVQTGLKALRGKKGQQFTAQPILFLSLNDSLDLHNVVL